MPTPHIEAEVGSIAPIVITAGDPKRCQYIANKYLKNVVLVNSLMYSSVIISLLHFRYILLISLALFIFLVLLQYRSASVCFDSTICQIKWQVDASLYSNLFFSSALNLFSRP